MARLKDIVDECLAVATAYTAINSQTYNEVNAVNYEDNDKDFPMFLFDKRNIGVNVDRFTRTNLPSQTTYSCQVLFFNTYTETEKLTIDLQTKQDDLIIIADRFFAELRTRTQSTNKGFHLGEISFNAIDETHNEQLIQLSYTVQFIANIENCDLGTFDDYLEYVNLIINEVETIQITDSTTFNLTVTLDGVESGSYNSGTQTWEVVGGGVCADATYTIKDRDENTLYSGSIGSGDDLQQYIENTIVEVNDSSFADVLSQGSINIQVVNTENTQKGSKVGSAWLLPDTTYNIYVNAVLDQTFSVPTLKNETINITP